MRTFVLKINVNNLRREIDNNYFKFRDIFYKCLIVNLCIYHNLRTPILLNSVIEDSNYNQYLILMSAKQQFHLKEAVLEIDPAHNVNILLDMNLYLEEFINIKHTYTCLNVYSLTIDDDYQVVITLKHIKA